MINRRSEKTFKKENKFLGVGIKDGYTYLNLLAIIIVPFFANALSTDFLALTTELLSDKDYFDLHDNELSQKVSDLNFYTIPS